AANGEQQAGGIETPDGRDKINDKIPRIRSRSIAAFLLFYRLLPFNLPFTLNFQLFVKFFPVVHPWRWRLTINELFLQKNWYSLRTSGRNRPPTGRFSQKRKFVCQPKRTCCGAPDGS